MVKYPFLPRAREHIAELELDFETMAGLKAVRDRAKERIVATFELAIAISQEPSKQFEIEVASYPLSLIYATGIGDPKLTERFALFESKRINEYLKIERNRSIILEIANAFGWEVHNNEDSSFSIHFTKFLQNTSRGRLFHDLKWKLINRTIQSGWVRISPVELARLLQEEVQKRIEDSTRQELAQIPDAIRKDIDELKTEFLKRKPLFEEVFEVVRAQESEYPPCIKRLMDRAAKGQHLSHVERFTLVTYLIHQNISVDTIVSLFSNVSDFKEDKTRYQVENLAGKSGLTKPYVTYNCSSLQTHGVCSGPVDSVCRTIKNPLTYHLRKQWRARQGKE
jgi:DNA primase large subunit